MDKLNIASVAKGALMERADVEIENVLKNILDKNTDWKKARKVTLELEFKSMDDTRESVQLGLKAKSSVSPYTPVLTQLFLGKDNNGQVIAEEYAKHTIPGQTAIQVDKETGEILEATDNKAGRKIVNINR